MKDFLLTPSSSVRYFLKYCQLNIPYVVPLFKWNGLVFFFHLYIDKSFKYLSLTVFFCANFFLLCCVLSIIKPLWIKNMVTPTLFLVVLVFCWLRKCIILCGSDSRCVRFNSFFFILVDAELPWIFCTLLYRIFFWIAWHRKSFTIQFWSRDEQFVQQTLFRSHISK